MGSGFTSFMTGGDRPFLAHSGRSTGSDLEPEQCRQERVAVLRDIDTWQRPLANRQYIVIEEF